MRVSEVTHGLGLGGAEVALAARLRQGGARETLVVNTCPRLDALEGEIRRTGAALATVDLMRGLGLIRLVHVLRQSRPDVVVAHSPTVVVVLAVARWSGLLRAPLVVVAHNEATRPLFARLLPIANRAAALHVAVSHRVATAAQCRKARRVVVRYLGADTPLGGEEPSAGSGPVFAYVGRHTRQKRLDVLIDAVALASSEFRDAGAQFLVAGAGPDTAMLQELVRERSVTDLVQFLGVVRPVSGLLARADALVMSSDHEGLPIAVFEAMLAGLLVVSTDVGGVAEVAQADQGHVMVPRRDPVALAVALRRVTADVNAIRRGRARRRLAATRYDTATVARDITSLLSQVAGGSSGPSTFIRPDLEASR